MRCPFCAHDDSQVKDSRPTEDSSAIRRRRQCEGCGARFTTFERVQLRDVLVAKSGGRREPFDRRKLEQSIALAVRKRGIEQERIDQLVSGIQRQVETAGENEVASSRIGALVGDPAVRQIRTNQNEVALFVTRGTVADETYAAALGDQSELDLGVEVPTTTEAMARDLHQSERFVAPESDLFERSFHRRFVKWYPIASRAQHSGR